MKVYCDRLAEVMVNTKNNTFKCPKCEGNCFKSTKKENWWDCYRCGRGWEKVPNKIMTEAQAEVYLMENT